MIFQRCCFCFRLRTGAVILGWMGIATYLFYVALSVFAFINIDDISKKVPPPPNSDVVPDEWKIRLEIVIGCMLVVSIINIISASLLIIGVIRENRYLLLPWLIGGMTSIIFTTSTVFSCLTATEENVGTFIGAGVGICIELYLWLCVYSLYKEIGLQQYIGQTTSLLHNNKPQSSAWNYQTI